MKTVMAILLLGASALAQRSALPAAGQLVGTWRLVSMEDTTSDGR